jgi:hypothetical protein
VSRTRRPPRPPAKASRVQQALDSWFPTLVRYAGLGLMGWAVFFDHLAHIELVTASAGMILFKNVWGR